MNAGGALQYMEHDSGIMSCNDEAWPVAVRALRLLAAIEGAEGETPETDALRKATCDGADRIAALRGNPVEPYRMTELLKEAYDHASRLERERNAALRKLNEVMK